MRKQQVQIIVGLLLCFVTALAVPQAAMAAGTLACTPIGNTAAVAYNVGGFAQAVVSSNTNTFTVGNKVNHTVVTTNASPGVSVVSNEAGAVLTFTITNNGNAQQTYVLTATDLASGSTTSVFSGNNTVTDGFNTFSKTTSMATTGIVSENTSTTVTIIATMPAGLTDNTYAVLSLTAQAYKINGTTAEANNSSSITSSFGTCVADVVLGDVAGTDDIAGDGMHAARSAYHVVLTSLTVNKTSVVYSDTVNGTYLVGTPKAIPGAIMEYIIGITNTGNQTASTITVTDTLPGTLTPLSGATWTSRTGVFGPNCLGQAQVNIDSTGWQCLTGGIGSSSWNVQQLSATINALNSGQTATILYQATIN
jgi:uncharacterized repeat protein (TIGR01451 family)